MMCKLVNFFRKYNLCFFALVSLLIDAFPINWSLIIIVHLIFSLTLKFFFFAGFMLQAAMFSRCFLIALLAAAVCGDVLRFKPRYDVDELSDNQNAGFKSAAGDHWALIVAGSNGWYNYRHQVGPIST